MTFPQISQRGKEYLKTAQTLLRAAQTMTDRAIAGQLKALADDYQRRAEKASHVDAAKAFTSFLFLRYRLRASKLGLIY